MARKPTTKKPEHSESLGAAELIPLARRVTRATGCPVVGGVAVLLHGGGRSTSDIDIFSGNLWETHQRLEAEGVLWSSQRREHLIDGVPVHLVSEEQLGGPPRRVSVVQGVSVFSLADIVRVKLTLGLESVKRSKDLAHVLDLIERVPLRKDFAARLPSRLRAPFRALVEEVHGGRGSPTPPARFRRQWAGLADQGTG